MIESLITSAMPYLTDLILKNEEIQKFPNDFIAASTRWIRSWFLEDDPVTKMVVESNSPVVAKEAVLEAKLRDLLKNPQFEQELKAQLEGYQSQRSYIKNVVDNAKIEAEGSVHIGDKGADSMHYDKKNILEGGSTIKSKDFHLGDTRNE